MNSHPSHLFWKSFLKRLKHLQLTISDSSPLACYSWKMSTQNKSQPTASTLTGPPDLHSAEGNASSRSNSLKTGTCARFQVIALESPLKANFAQPQSNQQKIGFVPSFCPIPASLRPKPPALDASWSAGAEGWGLGSCHAAI
jgi:hypothetical protein